ncbi:unnamed protein product [Heligmosomoides polygyrus]|uniref:Uncharacterized protein n=1 Tax=Heligmosomoides polygyrus TaxID=6339 RepID=A0A183FUY1_HELPZ|nr:unnamed protein product [Heligmosomoides polygyrus]
MDVSVAIIQPRRSATADRSILTPHDYDVVVLDEPSTSYNVPKPEDLQPYPVKKRITVGGHRVASTVIKLPSFRVTDCSASLADSVLGELTAKTRSSFRRTVAIPLWDGDGPTSSGRIAPGTVLMCAPVLPKVLALDVEVVVAVADMDEAEADAAVVVDVDVSPNSDDDTLTAFPF